MKKTTVREIRSTFGRFFAILAIIALGTGFFTGVRITTPAMVSMMNSFYQDKQLYDYRLVSTLGWEKEDAEAFRKASGVRYAEPSYSMDTVCLVREGEKVVKMISTPSEINKLQLMKGRLPENDSECVIDEDFTYALRIGDKLTFSAENDEDTLDSFRHDGFTVVGIVRSALYINFERGSSSVGNGSVDAFAYVLPEAFDMEAYTDIYVKFDNDSMIYSDEYNDFMELKKDKWEKLIQQQADARYERIVSDARDELQDGKLELADSRSDGLKELKDAKNELDEAEEKLNDAEKELNDSKKKLDDGEKELAEAKKKIDDGQVELENAKQQLDSTKIQLDESEQQIIEGEEEIRNGQAQIDAAKEQISAAEADIAMQANRLTYSKYDFDMSNSRALSMLDMLPTEQREMLIAALTQLQEAHDQLQAARDEVAANKQALAQQQSELDANRRALEAGRTELENGRSQYEEGLKEYNASLEEFNKGKKEYEDSLKEYQEGKKKYEEGLAEYEKGLKEYQEGLEDYQSGRKEFDDKISDAQKEIDDAEKDIDDIKHPDTFLLDRNTNIGYACFENDSKIVEQVARVFPVFFILVAALVCMTTMSRMVEEQRTQIGVFKALGYSNLSIMGKFLFYSGTAAIMGCIIGYALGTFFFPRIIWMTYKLMYIPLEIPYMFDHVLAAAAVIVSLLCSVGTTWIACRYELGETAASLMRPKAPKAGKRVFLEYVPFLWKRLKFLHKVSIRNILRYKGRLFMMILGIGGCTALLLTGFGIKDSIAGFADVQYEEIQISDSEISFKSSAEKKMRSLLDEKTDNYALLNSSSWDIIYGNKVKSITLKTVEDLSQLAPHMVFRSMNGEPLEMPQTGEALVSHSIAERYGAELGEEIILRNDEMKELHLKVAGIFENHVYNYVFISADTYNAQMDTDAEFNGAFINFPKNADKGKTAAVIAKNKNVTNLTMFSDVKVRMGNMMSSLDYIVLLIIICAAGLAFIVIYNLTNINITERIREIATIKVLGFFRRESSAYVLRENIVLTAIGVICGLGLGILLHKFVMHQIVVDLVDFRARIEPMSFVYSIILTFVFTFVVDLFMEIKLERINMAESLKSVD